MEETCLVPGQSPNAASHPSSGAEQTEKADAPREPPSVELKPDPTSGMAAAEAEALSESSEQGALPQPGLALPHVPHCPVGSPLRSSLPCLALIHLSFFFPDSGAVLVIHPLHVPFRLEVPDIALSITQVCHASHSQPHKLLLAHSATHIYLPEALHSPSSKYLGYRPWGHLKKEFVKWGGR